MINLPFSGTVPAVTTAVTVSTTALLSTLVTLNANLCALTLIPRPGTVVNWNIGGDAADDTTPELPTGGIHFPCTKAVADTIHVHSNSAGVNLDVIQHI